MKPNRDATPGHKTRGRHEEGDIGSEDEQGRRDVQLHVRADIIGLWGGERKEARGKSLSNLDDEVADDASEGELDEQPRHRRVHLLAVQRELTWEQCEDFVNLLHFDLTHVELVVVLQCKSVLVQRDFVVVIRQHLKVYMTL